MVIVNNCASSITHRVFFMGQLALLLICGAASSDSLWAQKEPAKSASTDNTSTKGQDGASGLGFSIESEMLTYRALESDSEAVACDIAAYLSGGTADFNKAPAGEICTVNAGTNSNASVIIVPFDRTAFDDFRLWRADMETMNELRKRAATYCPASPVGEVKQRGASPPSAKHPVSAAGSALSLTPAGSALSLAQSALALMSSEASTSPVGGTIEDQAFMDGVARELRSLSVRVLMPTIYGPYSLTLTDESQSPFLSNLDKLFLARTCLEEQKDKPEETQTRSNAKTGIDKLIADIDAYLATLGGRAPAAARTNAPSPSKSGDGCTGTQACGGTSTAAPPASSPSHLMALLSADGLAQKVGVDPATGLLPDNAAWQHILLLKALESGGAIQKKSSILATKIRYSGGSIGTYALFSMDGELECSGNVYDYGGSIPAEKFKEELRHYKPDPAAQFIFQRGGCRALVKR
jgi:hypothetical protein